MTDNLAAFEEEKCVRCGACCKVLTKRHKSFITTRCTVIILFIIGFLFLAAGISFIVLTNNMFEQEVDYNEECLHQIQQNNFTSNNCTVYFNITETLKGEVIFLYHLSNFYQNHRRIFQSKSEQQIRGSHLLYNKLSSCAPKISENGSKDPSALYLPCGLAPFSFLNDTYHFTDPELSANFSEEGISLVQERENLYKPLSPQYKEGIRWLEDITPKGTTDEHFIVWMRTAAMPNFIKVFSVCHDCEINPGSYEVLIQMNYPQSMYDGRRSIIITTTSALGSRSYFISVTYIAVGGLSLLFAVICLIQLLCCPRRLGQIQSIFPIEKSITINQKLTATPLPIRHSSRRRHDSSIDVDESTNNEKQESTDLNQPYINIDNSSDSSENHNKNSPGEASEIITERTSILTDNNTNNNKDNDNPSADTKINDENTNGGNNNDSNNNKDNNDNNGNNNDNNNNDNNNNNVDMSQIIDGNASLLAKDENNQ